ncbi:MAG: TRAP transporter substrate-binding protein [Betaproteobacteria bacterium]|nr:TRAP transporter substrate-binding protein [Betaproteobacteria bacterium]
MRSKTRRRLLGAAAATTALGLTPGLLRAQAKPIELKLSHWFPVGHFQHQDVLVPWAETVEKRSAGRLKITIFAGGVLGKPADHWDMAQNDIVDIAWGSHNYTPGRFQLTSAMDLPFLTRSAKGASRALWEYYLKHLQKEHARVKLLWLQSPAPFQLHMSKKAPLTPEQFAGLRIRAGGGQISEIIKSLGGVPVAMAVPETYNAIERGIVDGTALPYEALHGWKLAEVTKHHVAVNMYTTSNFLTMSLAKYNSLPAELKKVLDESTGARGSEFAGAAWDKGEEPGIEAARKAGNQFYKLTPEQRNAWIEKSKGVEIEWLRSMEAKGLPGKQALADLRGFLKRYDS